MTQSAGVGQVLLSLEGIGVSFGNLRAVKDVSLSLRGGDLLGLIGPNGAGKTTLLRAACGLQPLSLGRIRIMDAPLDGDREVLRHIGFTPDTPAMYDDLTVRQYLQFIGMGYDLSSAETEERIDFWLEKVWLGEKAQQKIKQLSRGMRQRVGIARTLLPNPAVILLDEPAAGLDPAGRAQFRQLLCNLRDQQKALIVSSHILADMEEYCTHIGIMSAGQMLRYGTVAQISHGAGMEDQCRYTVVLARAVAQIEAVVRAISGVSAVAAEGERVVMEYQSGKEPAAQLLAELMRLGLPVAAFTPNVANLEEAYLRAQVGQVD